RRAAPSRAVKENRLLVPGPAHAAQVRVLRMRVDQKPWDNADVRNALKAVQNRQKILDTAYFSSGQLGADYHVAPSQPEYFATEPPKHDPDGAKALLTKAGMATLDLT